MIRNSVIVFMIIKIQHKGPVKIYQVPRPGFGKLSLKKDLRPPNFFSEKKSSTSFFS